MSAPSHQQIGASPRPRDRLRLVRGQGRYCDDVQPPDCLHVTFLRSDVASGRIAAIDSSAARSMPGVLAVHSGADVAALGVLPVNEVLPMAAHPGFPVLAQQTVQAVGQPLAAVLSRQRNQGLDAAEAILVEIEDRTRGAPARIAAKSWTTGGAMAEMDRAAHIAECTLAHARLAPLSLEPRAICVEYDRATDRMTVWHSTQTPHRSKSALCAILGLPEKRLRVIAPDVGGAFGMKASLYPEEVFVVWAAMTHRQSVKWSATRSEDFLSATHGRGLTCQGCLAVDDSGRFTALTADIVAPLGGWLPNSALVPAWNAARVLPGPYVVPEIEIATQAVAVNRAPTGIYRGAGRPEAATLMERLVDKAARATGLDPFEIRLRNLLPPEALPHETPTGSVLDSGDYAQALHRLRELSDYATRKQQIAARRKAGELVGIGISFYLEPSGNGWESARVTWHDADHATVHSGSSAQGQPRAVSYAQIAADTLDLPLDAVEVIYGDTETCPVGIGAVASRSTPIGGSAVLRACQAVRAARQAGKPFPLREDVIYENDGQAWGYGCYLVQLSIDADTGCITVEHAVCVDDTGIAINPQAVADQITGGYAQGLGEALMEAVAYDPEDQLLTASLMDYAVPRAQDVPPLALHKIETPSPMNALGAKGVGEAGTIGVPVALLNAAIDALAPLGVTDLQMPLSPHNIWQAIRRAQETPNRKAER